MPKERRRSRKCPSCGGESIVRGSEVQGIGVTVTPQTEVSSAVTLPAYSDICYDCGLVSLFVRVGKFKQETG